MSTTSPPIDKLELKRQAFRLTSAAPVIDERIASLEDGEPENELVAALGLEDETPEEQIALLEQKREALKLTSAAAQYDETIAALKEAN